LDKKEAAMIVYVTTQGSRIVREGRHLLVKKEDATYHTLFIYKLEQLLLFGNITVTPQALNLLLRENIDTVFLRLDGRYKGRLAGAEPKNVFLRKRQFALCDDTPFCVAAARSIVFGKLMNMATIAQRISRTRNTKAAADYASDIRQTIRKLDEADSLDTLRGLEGYASARYFSALQYGLDKDWGFRKRVRRPPTDPVNSILSLLYTFIINRAYSAVRIAGLDPYPGVFHALDYGRHSLPLDLVEEFRPIIADTLTLALFNMGVLKEDDFYQVEPPPPETGYLEENLIDQVCADSIGQMTMDSDDGDIFDIPEQKIDDDLEETAEHRDAKRAVKLYSPGFTRVLRAFERKIQTEFYHPNAGTKMTYAEAMIFQARHFRQLITGEAAEYQPLLLK